MFHLKHPLIAAVLVVLLCGLTRTLGREKVKPFTSVRSLCKKSSTQSAANTRFPMMWRDWQPLQLEYRVDPQAILRI